MRSLRSEAASLAVTLAVPAMVAAAFPYAALRFRADVPAGGGGMTVSCVTLSAAEERKAVRAARTSFRGESGDVRWMRADLSGELASVEFLRPILSAAAAERSARMETLTCGRVPYLPSQRALPAERIERDGGPAVALPFSRDDLLRIE